MPGTDDIQLNPTLSLSISWTLRVANRPFQRYRAEIPRDLGLLIWLLRTFEQGTSTNATELEIEIPEGVLEEAIAKGLLITPEDDPGDVAPFACAIEPSLLALVPAADRAEADALAAGGAPLALNPGRWLQTSPELPAPLAGRLVVDESLRARVGRPKMGPFEGVPRGLAPFGADSRLWVEHPETGVLQPYEIDRSVAELLARLESGALAPRDMPAPVLALLLLSQIVIPERAAGAEEEDARRLGAIRERLAKEKYLVIPNAVSPLLVAALRRHFRELRRAGHLDTDQEQVRHEKRDGIYCEFTSLYLQDQLCRFLNGVVPAPIKPSYTFFFRYHSEAVLDPHRDRPQCLWNVSLAIDADPDDGRSGAWPLCFEVQGETRAVNLGLGDAVLYSGTELLHWRDALPAGRCVGVCFLHYVEAGFEGELG